MSTHEHFPQGDTRPARGGDERTDSSWISVFSVVSRPAWSFLQRYFPGRAQTSFEMNSNLDIGNSLAPLRVEYLHCQHENAAHASSRDRGTLVWFTHDSLSELSSKASISRIPRNGEKLAQPGVNEHSGKKARKTRRRMRFVPGYRAIL